MAQHDTPPMAAGLGSPCIAWFVACVLLARSAWKSIWWGRKHKGDPRAWARGTRNLLVGSGIS
eukprot:3590271-Lingulodinium_polyedra.AAC.1